MKKILILLTFLKSIASYSQNLTIEYQVKYKESMYNNRLVINDSLSEWQDVSTNESESQVKLFLIKKPSKQFVFFSDYIFSKTFYVIDTLHNMNWTLTGDKKEILGENCYSAKTFFRGRRYTAYYSTTIPYSNGPWKFGGLPGLILSISSDDKLYEFVANKIDRYANRKINESDIAHQKYIYWSDFVNQFKIFIDNTVKFAKTKLQTTDSDIKGYIKIDAPEIIYPKAQIGEGIEY